MSSAATSAYNEIRRQILTGTLAAGDRLRETQLVDELKVSRTPIREALRRLHAEGLVTVAPNKGARVASWSEQDLDDVFGLRLLVESYATRLAAQRIRPADTGRLEVLATALEQHLEREVPDYSAIAELNNEFHDQIVRAAQSDTVMMLLGTLVSVPTPLDEATHPVRMPLGRRAVLHYTREELERSVRHHRELIAALRAGDADWAESIIRTHTLSSRAALRSRRAGRPRLRIGGAGQAGVEGGRGAPGDHGEEGLQ